MNDGRHYRARGTIVGSIRQHSYDYRPDEIITPDASKPQQSNRGVPANAISFAELTAHNSASEDWADDLMKTWTSGVKNLKWYMNRKDLTSEELVADYLHLLKSYRIGVGDSQT